jgi:hypothetical protein
VDTSTLVGELLRERGLRLGVLHLAELDERQPVEKLIVAKE